MRGKSGEKLRVFIGNMLLIGSTGRNSGKTVLACSLIRQFSQQVPVIGLKVTTIHGAGTTCPRGGKGCGVCSSLDGDYCITRENDRGSDKDTAKMLAAGAREVLWLRVRAGSMNSAVKGLQELIPAGTPVIAESNTLRLTVKPGVFLMVRPRGSQEVKPSAKRVLEYADRIIEGDRERTAIDPNDVTFRDGRFFLRRNATLALLAGGGSSRMGDPKSLLGYKGQPLIVYIYKCLEPLFSEILVSVSVSGGESIPEELASLTVVTDEFPGRGPIAGIAASLAAASTDTVFVTACDIPTVHPGLVAAMLDGSRDCDIVVPRATEGFIEPLHAVYKRHVLPEVLELIHSGERRIRMLYDKVNTCYKNLEPGEELLNINTPEEYRRILG
ncbi:MAG: NTP transferase domain-containing protein [Spirochaetales bacterium]|nr:NTP transferase domain-containing protein [Spirochaetales bacterium]